MSKLTLQNERRGRLSRRSFLHSMAFLAIGSPTLISSCRHQPKKNLKTHDIEMLSDGGEEIFVPDRIRIAPGDTVKWILKSGFHSATAYHPSINDRHSRIPPTAEPWNSTLLRSDDAAFEHTFTVEGVYNYYCIPHEALGMLGLIVVGKVSEHEPAMAEPDDSLPIAAREKISSFIQWAKE